MPRMIRTIIAHVGASLLREECKVFSGFCERDNLLADLEKSQDVTYYLDKAATHLSAKLAGRWSAQSEHRLRESPAEISSLSLLDIGPGDRIVLLHSDTGEGAFCAEVLKRVLGHRFEPVKDFPYCAAVEALRIDGLRVTDVPGAQPKDDEKLEHSFVRKGLASYVKLVWEAYQELDVRWKDHKDGGGPHPGDKPHSGDEPRNGALIFNITAGYKGMIPIACDLALLLLAHSERQNRSLTTEVCYLYEESTQLIRFESLPVQFDWGRVTLPYLKRAAAEQDTPQHDSSKQERLRWGDIAQEEKRYFQPVDNIYARLSPLGRVVLEFGERIDHGTITAPLR